VGEGGVKGRDKRVENEEKKGGDKGRGEEGGGVGKEGGEGGEKGRKGGREGGGGGVRRGGGGEEMAYLGLTRREFPAAGAPPARALQVGDQAADTASPRRPSSSNSA